MAAGKITHFNKPFVGTAEDSALEVEVKQLPKKKMVMMDKKLKERVGGSVSRARMSFNDFIDMEMQRALDIRNTLHIEEWADGRMVDVTPKPINAPFETEAHKKLTLKARTISRSHSEVESFRSATSSFMRARSSRCVGLHLSLEDIIAGIGSEHMLANLKAISTLSPYIEESSSSSSLEIATTRHRLPFIRVVLRKTELMLLYEQHSMTAIKNTEDGNYAELDNKQYDYLTIGRGKVRRRNEAETQTENVLYKTRHINTISKDTKDTGSFVSYYEMYDTYRYLEEMDPTEQKVERNLQTVQHGSSGDEQSTAIVKLPQFQWANTVIKRLLAGNTFSASQRRYRHMDVIKPTVSQIDYKYALNNLFTIKPYAQDNERRAVADMSFCYSNNDILAVAYGIYSYQAAKLPNTGEVCVWSIKNPCDPERRFIYNYPAVSVEFSPYNPNLLAIGLFDGSVEVRDISTQNILPIAVSQRSESSSCTDPVLAIKWIKQNASNVTAEIEPFLALLQDGSVTRFQIINSPYLLGVKQMVLERIEGLAEGLLTKPSSGQTKLYSSPRPQGLHLTQHPLHTDIYYILTDEGCIYMCSTNYQHHYLSVLKTHEGSVNSMDFSPWSTKLFVTCGNDWYIRIWMEGIFKPLVTLQNMYAPYQWVGWSHTHSTILLALNRKQCEIWDLRRSIVKPVAIHPLESSYNTMAHFSHDGTTIAIGNERGKVFINALDEMPFPPHYQYDALENAITTAVKNFPDLMIELKSVGYFGYPNQGIA